MAGLINSVVAQLVIQGIRQVAPEVLDDTADLRAVDRGGADGVPLEPYRRVIQSAYSRGGGRLLLEAGRSLERLSHPFLFVLLNSDSPTILLEKEARLGEFIHSRHRSIVVDVGDRHLTIEHISRADSPPEPTEDLAGAGQHIVLLEEIGCQGLRLNLPRTSSPEAPVYASGDYFEPAPGGGYDLWAFAWDTYTSTRRPMQGLDELLLANPPARALSESQGTAALVEAVMRSDLGRTWRLPEVAAELGMAPRSLQRALASEHQRYSDVLDRVRNVEAARLLRATNLSVTEIGYICGFADAAHFSRSFKKRHDKAPSVFRAQA